MPHTRRQFLRRGLLAAPAAAALPGLMARAVAAPGAPQRNLVLIELNGGNDGFNTIVPYGVNGGSYYSEFRSSLAVAEGSLLKVDGQIGFHPALSHLKAHFDAGRLALIQGVSYPDPSFSHEVAARVWGRGSVDPQEAQGWLARLLAQYPEPSFPCAMDVAGSLTPVYQGSDQFIPAFTGLWSFQFPYDPEHWSDKDNRRAAYEAALGASKSSSAAPLQAMGATAEGVLQLIDTVALMPEYEHVGDYPQNWFASNLKLVATMMNAGLGMNLYHATLGGFDTHSDQDANDYHAKRLALLSQALDALYADVVHLGKAADTIFMVYSEFGRTVYQNGSGGTDHGTVNPVLVLGAPVLGGVVTTHPSMDPGGLDDHGEPPMTTDLRDVLGTVVSRWFGIPSATVFPDHTTTDLGFLP